MIAIGAYFKLKIGKIYHTTLRDSEKGYEKSGPYPYMVIKEITREEFLKQRERSTDPEYANFYYLVSVD